MPPVILKLFDEETIFEGNEDGGEKVIPIDTIFDFQTSLYFCVLYGKEKNWYHLYDDEDVKKEGERFAELKFVYSKKERLDVYSLNGNLTSVEDIKKYFTELNDQIKDWDILGIKNDCCGSVDIITKAWGTQKRIFSSEKDLSNIFNNARERLEKEIENRGCAEVTLDFSNIDIYLDDDFKGSVACTINYQPISSRAGEHKIVLKKGSNEIGSSKVQINPGDRTNVSIPIEGTTNVPSKVTLSLLVLLTIMSAIDVVWSPSILFILYLASFIGVFYKIRLASGLAIFLGFISFLTFDPVSLLLGIPMMVLGWKEYSALKT